MSRNTTTGLTSLTSWVQSVTASGTPIPWHQLQGMHAVADAVTNDNCILSSSEEDVVDLLEAIEAEMKIRVCEVCDQVMPYSESGEGTVTLQLPGQDDLHLSGHTDVCEVCADECSVTPMERDDDEQHPDIGKSWREAYAAAPVSGLGGTRRGQPTARTM